MVMDKGPIVILTGAGISAESGIQTFRGNSGLWENHRVEVVASPEGFDRDPRLVHRFYNERRKKLLSEEVWPNPAHRALGRLEEKFPHSVSIVTQNIDNLHERGGSKRVIHMHGEILKGFCMFCREGFDIHGDLGVEDVCVHCNRPGGMRPDIVWFGEIPYRMEEIYGLIQECALFIAIGTSGNVYPAAGFVELARQSGAHTLEVNLEPSSVKNSFSQHLYGLAGTIVPELVNDILSGEYDFICR